MADNTTLSTNVGSGDVIATDDIGGVKHQQVKVEFGADGTATPVSAANPIPTVQTGALPAGANAIGKLAANSGVDIGDVDVTSMPGQAADNAASLPAVLYVVGGWDGTNVQALTTDSSGLLQVDVVTAPTTAVTGPLTDAQLRAAAVPVDTELPAAAALADNTANPTVPGTGAFGMVWDGATWDRLTQPLTDTQLRATPVPVSGTVTTTPPANASTNLAQIVGTAADVNSGNKSAGTLRVTLATDQVQLTNALKVDGSAVTQPVSGTVTASGVTGSVAHDGADSGNPVKTGARAVSADITAVAANDRVDNLSTLLGKVMVMPYALPGLTLQGTGNKTDTTDLALIAAQGAGVRIYITHITITNAHASVGTKVVLKSNSTIIWRGYADALGGGVCTALPTPLRLTANEACNGAAVTTGADVDFTVVGYGAAE